MRSRIHRSKKGVMGIETLIIFIAMILVAAVAAGVLLRTSGLLQQRALAVGSEATQRVVTALEVISVNANADTTTNTFNEMELLIRLQAGSYDMSMLSVSMTINSEEFSHAADIQHSLSTDQYRRDFAFVDNETWINIGNLDFDTTDNQPDFMRVVHNLTPGVDGLEFDLSSYGRFNVSLGRNITSGELDIQYIPIKPHDGGNHAPVFGFFTYTGNASATGYINTSAPGTEAFITNSYYDDECRFDSLITNNKFCITTRIGNDDFVLQSGEVMLIRYKLSDEYTMGSDANFDIRLIPKYGTIIELHIYVPEVLQRRVLTLWP